MTKNTKKQQVTAELTNEQILAQKFVKLACAEDTRAEVIYNLCTTYGATFAKGKQIQPATLLKATYAAITLEVENSEVILKEDKTRVAENAKVAAKRCLYAALAVYKTGKIELADIQAAIKSVGFYKLWNEGTALNGVKSSGKGKAKQPTVETTQPTVEQTAETTQPTVEQTAETTQPTVEQTAEATQPTVETNGCGDVVTDADAWNSALALVEKLAKLKLERSSKLAVVAELVDAFGITLDEVKANEKQA